jgi:uncharacterized protein (TIGR02271 family)
VGQSDQPAGDIAERSLSRSDEQLHVGTREVEAGRVTVRKSVEPYDVERDIPRRVEEAETARVSPDEEDSGMVETLPDGSVSVPVFEERLVIRREVFVRERVIVQKRARTATETVRATLRREEVDVDADEGIEVIRGED